MPENFFSQYDTMTAGLSATIPSAPPNAPYVDIEHSTNGLSNVASYQVKVANEAYASSRRSLVYNNLHPNVLWQYVDVGHSSVAVYEPKLFGAYAATTLPIYVAFEGTDFTSLFSLAKDLDLLLDYTGYPNVMTSYSDDLASAITALRYYLENVNTTQQIEIIGHSLGAQYAQDFYLNLRNVAPTAHQRVASINLFNPFLIHNENYTLMQQYCLADTAFLNSLHLHIVRDDFASILVRTDPVGTRHIYPNSLGPSDPGFLLAIPPLAAAYQQYSNHSLSYFGNHYSSNDLEVVTPSIDPGVSGVSGHVMMQTFNAKIMPRFGVNSPQKLKCYLDSTSTLLAVNFPTASQLQGYNFAMVRSTSELHYETYIDFNGNLRVALPLSITAGDGTVRTLWLYNFSNDPSTNEKLYMIKMESGGVARNLRIPAGSFDAMATQFPMELRDHTDFDTLVTAARTVHAAGSTTYADVFNRSLFSVNNPISGLVVSFGHDELRRSEEDALAGNVKIINGLYDYYLVGGGVSTIRVVGDGGTGSPPFLDGVYSTDTHPSEAVWALAHISGTDYYEATNTSTNVKLGDGNNFEDVRYWNSTVPDANSKYSLQSNYDGGNYNDTPIPTNTSIHFEHVTRDYHSVGNYTDYYLMYVIEPTTNKRQYFMVQNDYPITDRGGNMQYINLVSEDYFNALSFTDASLASSVTDYTFENTLTTQQKLLQFCWRVELEAEVATS